MYNFSKYQTTVSTESITEKEVSSIETLDKLVNQVSNEVGFVSDVTDYIGRKGASIAVTLKEILRTITTFNHDGIQTAEPALMSTILNGLDFLEIENKQIPVPSGFSGEMEVYLHYLKEQTEWMSSIINDSIRPLKNAIGYYISNQEDRGHSRAFVETNLKFEPVDIERMGQFFSLNGRNHTAPYGEVYTSNSNFIECCRLINSIKSDLDKTKPEMVQRAVNDLTITLEALIKDIVETEDKTSDELIKRLMSQVQVVAKQVEAYSAVYTKIVEASLSIKQTSDVLRKLA